MPRLVHLVLLLAALSAVSARRNVCKRGYKPYPIKRGRIASSFDAGGADNFVAGLRAAGAVRQRCWIE